jgi:hypothetical protein
MASHYWMEVATGIVADHTREISAAIFREQADRESETWFAEHSQAARVLHACVKQDACAVWQSLKPYLASAVSAHSFSIGFPRGILERMPSKDVTEWIAENPEERTITAARLSNNDLSTDETLSSRLLGEYGDSDRVASVFFAHYVSGSWSGSASSHWDELAKSLEAVATRTKLPKLRRWASSSASSLRKMAERDRQREEEDHLHRQ